jgi:hypothetical protein
MNKLCLIASLLLLSMGIARAQSSDEERRLPINISYFGINATHPGLKVGVEVPFWERLKEKEKRNGNIRLKQRDLFVTSNVGFYHHQQNHSALFLNSEIGYRKTRNKRNQVGVLVGVGYMRTFLSGTTYQTSDSGTPEPIKLAGNSYFMPSFSFFLGEDLSERRGIPITWHLKPTVFFQTPYNHSFNVQAALELGITYQFKSFGIKRRAKS